MRECMRGVHVGHARPMVTPTQGKLFNAIPAAAAPLSLNHSQVRASV